MRKRPVPLPQPTRYLLPASSLVYAARDSYPSGFTTETASWNRANGIAACAATRPAARMKAERASGRFMLVLRRLGSACRAWGSSSEAPLLTVSSPPSEGGNQPREVVEQPLQLLGG
jgi:hypothetical protein